MPEDHHSPPSKHGLPSNTIPPITCPVRYHVMPEVAFVSWFLCLFFNVLPTETALRVWDCLIGVRENTQSIYMQQI